VPLNEAAERYRRRVLSPWGFRAFLWARLPLAACAGVSLRSLDAESCTVSLPGGWRTRNPFGSAYFAAQAMAAEMSTGAPAFMLVQGASASVAMILREVRAVFTKRITGRSSFTFADVAGMQAVVERAARSGQSEAYTGRSIGRTADGAIAAEFDITWSFKRRA
jgi:hypothetical protein